MDQRRLILLGTLLLTVLAAAFYWYGESDNGFNKQAKQEHYKHFAPEAIVAGYQQTIFNELGTRQYQMEAKTVTHYSQQEAAEMAMPIITFYTPNETQNDSSNIVDDNYYDQTDWVAKAKTGIVQDQGDTLVLSGNVNVIKPIKDSEALTFSTESLLIKPNDEIAKTDEPVTLKQAQHITEAKGLVIDIAAGKVELLSNVRSQYVPAQL